MHSSMIEVCVWMEYKFECPHCEATSFPGSFLPRRKSLGTRLTVREHSFVQKSDEQSSLECNLLECLTLNINEGLRCT
jgi:hypothetical protein